MPALDAFAQLKNTLAGRYDIEREIGAGGMATVYLARDLKHDRPVALKVLNPELGALLGVERFLAEIKVTANLQHPNLLPLFDSGEAAGLLFYVMPYVEGESLRARLEREKQIPIDEAIRIASAIASALDYAHRHQVIHRDLKPENILLSEGQPLIADFGIALAVSNAGGNRITQTGLSLGTPQYMSPEQATGDRAIDSRTDIYSLGAVLYEMLTGEPPHIGSTSQAIIARVLTERPRSVRVSRPNVSAQVDLAVERALEKLPADRWATAGQFGEALHGTDDSLLQSRITAARGLGGGPRRAEWRASTRSPLVLTLAALLIVAVAVAGREWVAARADRVQTVVRFPLSLPSTAFVGTLTGSNVAVSPDGRTVAYCASAKGEGFKLFVRTLDEIEPRVIQSTAGVQQPFFSPDGKWIGFWANGKLKRVSVDGTSVLPISELALNGGASWSPSGLIVVSVNNRLATIPSTGGTPRVLPWPESARGEVSQLWPVALPDGEHALYASWGAGGLGAARIAVVSLITGKADILDLPGTYPLGVADGYLVYVTASQTVMVVPFDVRSRRVTGTPTPVATEVAVGAAGAAKAALSASGSLAFQSGSQVSQVVLADMRGGTRVLMADARPYLYPRFSPDGKRIALTIGSAGRSDVWIYDVATATATRLTTDGTSNERPEWSPDGKRVLYRTDRARRSSLWWQPADLSGPATPLLASDKADYYEGVLTPDGGTLIYQLDTAGADVYYRRLAGDTMPKTVSATAAVEDEARISPDGKWVALATDASGTLQVVVQPFPGPGGQMQVSNTGGTEPVWSRDGRRLYYREGHRFVAVTFTTSPTFAVTARSPLFDDTFVPAVSPHANYDVSPDGTQLLLLKPTESPQFIVVHNWLAEVRARMAAKR